MICDYPIQLADEETGETITVPCGATDPAMCEGCADLHAGDVRALIREGLDEINGPATFITLTAPGDIGGKVHSRPTSNGGARACGCGEKHSPDDPQLGLPLEQRTFDYEGVAQWNSSSRRLVTVALQKLSRIVGRRLVWVGVPELQRRGLTHWHILIAGVVPRAAVGLAVNGGINWTGRKIRPSEHDGHRLGRHFDAQLMVSQDARQRAGRYVAKYVSKGLASVEGLTAEQTQHRQRITAHLARLRAAARKQPRHWRMPPALLQRHATHTRWADPALRRASRTGHPGRTFAYSRTWPVRVRDLKQRRRDFHAAQGSLCEPRPWTYAGRGACLPSLLARETSEPMDTTEATTLLAANCSRKRHGCGDTITPDRRTS